MSFITDIIIKLKLTCKNVFGSQIMKIFVVSMLIIGFFFIFGCASINVDAKIPSAYVSHSPRVDSSKVPKTSTHAECREELERAYEYIRYLERKVEKREKKIAKLEKDKKELKRKISRLEDKLEKYED